MWNLLRKLRRRLHPEQVGRFWRNREYLVRPAGWRRLFVPWYDHANKKILDRFNALVPCSDKVQPFATPHGLCGIFISFGATVGKGCTILHQVTIGSNTLAGSRGQGAPVIGDNVYIGAGAKIIGGVTVGDNARIGANAVVTFDVPANATVVQQAPRVILHDAPRDNTSLHWDQWEAGHKP